MGGREATRRIPQEYDESPRGTNVREAARVRGCKEDPHRSATRSHEEALGEPTRQECDESLRGANVREAVRKPARVREEEYDESLRDRSATRARGEAT